MVKERERKREIGVREEEKKTNEIREEKNCVIEKLMKVKFFFSHIT